MAAENTSAVHHLPPDTILHGKYLLSGVIGEGGFGITYTGRDLALDMKVAVKEYYPTGFVTREVTVTNTVQPFTGTQGEFFRRGRERFMREAHTLAKFASLPGIVSARDFFEENGTAYLVMEFIDGQTFKAYLEKMGGRLPPQQVFEMMRPVMLALRQVHAAGVIHRDVSPDNIMISDNGYMKLLDFGAAQDYAEERSRTVMVKQGFAPYEQYQTHGNQGPWTDVYALCATMYRAITGVTPPESTERMYEDTLWPPSAFGVALQPGQEEALMRGLALRAEERTQDVDTLLAVLAPVYAQVYAPPPPEAQPAFMPAPPKPQKEKKPFVWPLSKKLTAILAGALAVVIAVCVGVPALVKNRDNPGQPVTALTGIAAEIAQGETRNLQFGPYTWRVLDVQDGRVLLITEEIVEDKRTYNNAQVNTTWETCSLRKYLNGAFYENFSAQEQAMILETRNANPDNPWFGTDGGSYTSDKIFLLSIEEVVKYFGDSGRLKNRVGSEYYFGDEYSDARLAEYDGGKCWWWLRSPGSDPDRASLVNNVGGVGLHGDGVGLQGDGTIHDGGVRPALWLKLESFTPGILATNNAGAITEAPTTPELTAAFQNQNYKVGDTVRFGLYRWRVLDVQNDRALLITEEIVEDKRTYNDVQVNITWETCSLRRYLNSAFYGKFSAQEQAMILETRNANPDNPWFGTDGGNYTSDKIFLLSIEEVVKYFGDSGRLKNRIGNEYYFGDEYSDARLAEYDGGKCWWWLRSPGSDPDRAALVNNVGGVGLHGDGVGLQGDGTIHDGGVRPALWLRLEAEAPGEAPTTAKVTTKDSRVYVTDMSYYADASRNHGKYTGYTLNGKPEDSNGTFVYDDGRKYVGAWKDGKQHGQGTFTLANGNKYVGAFKDDDFSGQGILTYANGEKYVGEFERSLKNGYGTYYNADGTIRYQGQWKDGEFVG